MISNSKKNSQRLFKKQKCSRNSELRDSNCLDRSGLLEITVRIVSICTAKTESGVTEEEVTEEGDTEEGVWTKEGVWTNLFWPPSWMFSINSVERGEHEEDSDGFDFFRGLYMGMRKDIMGMGKNIMGIWVMILFSCGTSGKKESPSIEKEIQEMNKTPPTQDQEKNKRGNGIDEPEVKIKITETIQDDEDNKTELTVITKKQTQEQTQELPTPPIQEQTQDTESNKKGNGSKEIRSDN